MSEQTLGLGVLGFGGFGLFAVQHFTQVAGLRLVGMGGTHREAAFAAAERFGIPEPVEPEALVSRPDVDVVYIATPPFLHHKHAMLALEAGKHVVCEKPLALSLEQADEMIGAARERDLLVVANLMQRYNPVFDAVGKLLELGPLGELLHGYFENYATDEGLSADHWFWDREKSGGIFVEHGVHFFDLFAGWLGEGRVASAQVSVRPGTNIEDQVQCAVRYRDGVMVNFYHGFTQTGRMDRQELRLIFERGDVTLLNWVPTVMRIRTIANERNTRALCELFPGARQDILENYPPKQRICSGRHKALDIYQKFELTYGEGHDKMVRYGELLRRVMEDQTAWIRDRRHQRRITEQNGRDSLATALRADALAHGE